VPLIAWLERQVAGLGEDHLVAEQRAEGAFQDEAVLVLVVVAVHRSGQMPERYRVLDQGEPAARFLARDHQPGPAPAEIDVQPVAGAHDPRPLRRVEANSLLHPSRFS